jgi:hypothetical protein
MTLPHRGKSFVALTNHHLTRTPLAGATIRMGYFCGSYIGLNYEGSCALFLWRIDHSITNRAANVSLLMIPETI